MGSGFFFILGIVLSNTYRPYIYENHIFDFHLADTIGNLVAVPSLSLLLLAMRKYESLSKAILYSIFVFTLYEIIPFGTFDFYYLINNENLDKDKLLKCFDILIFKDEGMKENNVNDIFKRLNRILHNRNYLRNLNTAKNNWLVLPIEKVVENVLVFFGTIEFANV